MNKYYCVACNTESIINSLKPEIASCSCTKCKKQTVHRWVSLKGKETPKEGATLPPQIIPPSIPLKEPVKQPTVMLDVPGGAVKVETPKPANQIPAATNDPLAGMEKGK